VTVASGGPGLGASFTVTLPKEDAFEDPGKAAGPVLSGVSILLVETDASARDGHCAIFEAAGARITLPESADEAARLLRTSRFDVVVCGSGMTARERDTLIEAAHHAGGAIPAVLVSNVASVQDDAAATVTPDAMLVEPFSSSDLVRVVVRLLRGVRQPNPATRSKESARSR
jgi:DNA-binding NtrC family response regulator